MTSKELYGEKDIPDEYLKEIKKFSGAYEFVTGRMDEFNTLVSVWFSAGTYKIIRAFIISPKSIPVISVDADMVNAHVAMAKLLTRY